MSSLCHHKPLYLRRASVSSSAKPARTVLEIKRDVCQGPRHPTKRSLGSGLDSSQCGVNGSGGRSRPRPRHRGLLSGLSQMLGGASRKLELERFPGGPPIRTRTLPVSGSQGYLLVGTDWQCFFEGTEWDKVTVLWLRFIFTIIIIIIIEHRLLFTGVSHSPWHTVGAQ